MKMYFHGTSVELKEGDIKRVWEESLEYSHIENPIYFWSSKKNAIKNSINSSLCSMMGKENCGDIYIYIYFAREEDKFYTDPIHGDIGAVYADFKKIDKNRLLKMRIKNNLKKKDIDSLQVVVDYQKKGSSQLEFSHKSYEKVQRLTNKLEDYVEKVLKEHKIPLPS